MDIIAVIIAVLGSAGIGGVIAALVTARKSHSEIKINEAAATVKQAEAAAVLSQAWERLLTPINQELSRLRGEIDGLRRELLDKEQVIREQAATIEKQAEQITCLEADVMAMQKELESLGHPRRRKSDPKP